MMVVFRLVSLRSRPVAAVFLGWLVLALLPAGLSAQERPAYHLGPGDHLRITVYEDKDLTGEYDVTDQGTVTLPLVGPVRIGGRTLAEAETVITDKYGKDYIKNPHVNVEVLNYRPFFILGEVQKPGSYPYQNGMTVIQAVSIGGGYTPRAQRSHITMKRASNPGAGEQEVSEDTPVLPGDVVRVPERFF
jgi:protein involved in polysaccharide export with SLBB domain